MKFFAVLVLTLLAQIYTISAANFEHGLRSSMFATGKHSRGPYQDYSEEDRYDSRRNTDELSWNLLSASPRSGSMQFKSSASRLPQAETYKTKVLNRLQGSQSDPELKQKLIKVADQKLEGCKTHSGDELDTHCVGRATGQIMQLIAAVENVNRPVAGVDSNENQSSSNFRRHQRQYDY